MINQELLPTCKSSPPPRPPRTCNKIKVSFETAPSLAKLRICLRDHSRCAPPPKNGMPSRCAPSTPPSRQRPELMDHKERRFAARRHGAFIGQSHHNDMRRSQQRQRPHDPRRCQGRWLSHAQPRPHGLQPSTELWRYHGPANPMGCGELEGRGDPMASGEPTIAKTPPELCRARASSGASIAHVSFMSGKCWLESRRGRPKWHAMSAARSRPNNKSNFGRA